jgi:pimeloyl-ACP methyl ester carboxylesterase
MIARWTMIALALIALIACATPRKATVTIPFLSNRQIVELTDYRASYVREGRGPQLILIHGGGTWSYSWRRNIEALAKSYDVIAVDMPGHGFTSRTASTSQRYTLRETNAFLHDFTEKLGIGKAVLVGSSWGGGWAMSYAQSFPERVNGLVLIGTSGTAGKERPEWEMMKWPVIGDVMIRLARRSDIEEGQGLAVADPLSVSNEDVDALWQAFRQQEVRKAQVGFMRGLDWQQTERLAPTMKVPTLILWGEQDRYVQRSSQELLANLIPGAHFRVVPIAGHLAHEDQPTLVNALITEFIESSQR